jgi:hypothetical protein
MKVLSSRSERQQARHLHDCPRLSNRRTWLTHFHYPAIGAAAPAANCAPLLQQHHRQAWQAAPAASATAGSAVSAALLLQMLPLPYPLHRPCAALSAAAAEQDHRHQ